MWFQCWLSFIYFVHCICALHDADDAHTAYFQVAKDEIERHLKGNNVTKCYSLAEYKELIDAWYATCTRPPHQLLHYRIFNSSYGELVSHSNYPPKATHRVTGMLKLMSHILDARKTPEIEFDILINVVDTDFTSGYVTLSKKAPSRVALRERAKECSVSKVPVFTVVRKKDSPPFNMLFVDPDFHDWLAPNSSTLKDLQTQKPFEEKQNKVIFRGRNTDSRDYRNLSTWMWNPRIIASLLSNINPLILDAGLSDTAKQFTSPEVKEAIKVANLMKPKISKEQLLDHKYLLVIDGNTWSRTNKFAIAANSVSMKQDSQWFEFFEQLPDYNTEIYIPISRYMDDLVKNVEKAMENETKMKEIAKNGEEFAKMYLSREAIFSYANSLIDVTMDNMICPN
jgi:hypothetical protein